MLMMILFLLVVYVLLYVLLSFDSGLMVLLCVLFVVYGGG